MAARRRLRRLRAALPPPVTGGASSESLAKAKFISDDQPWQTTYVHSPRFELAEADAAQAHLEEYGFCIFRSVLSATECAASLSQLWDFLECLGAGIDRSTSDTWGTEAAELVFTARGVIHPHGVIHSAATWGVRSAPGVRKTFASVWGTEDLIASFDGLCVFRPWNVNRAWRTGGPWFHTDQPAFLPRASVTASGSGGAAAYEGPSGFRREYVQGFVNLIETTPASGGNVVVPKSHLRYEALARQHLSPETGGSGIPADHPIYRDGIRSHLGAGDVRVLQARGEAPQGAERQIADWHWH